MALRIMAYHACVGTLLGVARQAQSPAMWDMPGGSVGSIIIVIGEC
jgi:hypothetical protein